jgi:RNA recognition motif-containing protein
MNAKCAVRTKHSDVACLRGILLSATRAQRELSNFLFFGKPMRVTFAKAKSDVLAKLDGSFKQRAKRKGPVDDGRPKKGSGQPAKRQKKADGAAPSAAPAAQLVAASNEPPPPPHRILFVENLPKEANDAMMGAIFGNYPGFTEARVVAGKGVAFIEFKEVFQAQTAHDGMQNFQISQDQRLRITFAKR